MMTLHHGLGPLSLSSALSAGLTVTLYLFHYVPMRDQLDDLYMFSDNLLVLIVFAVELPNNR